MLIKSCLVFSKNRTRQRGESCRQEFIPLESPPGSISKDINPDLSEFPVVVR
jgi:hypothetical protein